MSDNKSKQLVSVPMVPHNFQDHSNLGGDAWSQAAVKAAAADASRDTPPALERKAQ